MHAEGWYRDPYGRHDDRWFSDGRPTRLVRDRGTESSDEPPPGDPPLPLVPVTEVQDSDGSDLKRADEAEWESEYDVERDESLPVLSPLGLRAASQRGQVSSLACRQRVPAGKLK
jgi:hypothetical protein